MGIAKFAFLFTVKSVSFLLITSDYGDIWQNNPPKIENKTRPLLCLQTWLRQNQPQVQDKYGCFLAKIRSRAYGSHKVCY